MDLEAAGATVFSFDMIDIVQLVLINEPGVSRKRDAHKKREAIAAASLPRSICDVVHGLMTKAFPSRVYLEWEELHG